MKEQNMQIQSEMMEKRISAMKEKMEA